MQSIAPLSASDFNDRAKEPVSKLEIYIDPAWISLCDLGGKNYLVEANYSKGQKELSYKPIAATIDAIIDDTDGNFHPENPDGSYNTYIKAGRKIRFSTGFKSGGIDYFWQWFEGVISDASRDNTSRQINLKGFDYSQYLIEVELKGSDNYWGTYVIKSTVTDQAKYNVHIDCNGVYVAYLDGSPVYEGEHWVYDRANDKFVFLPDYVPTSDGTNNLLIYYFTEQVPENVVADILVVAGLYADQAAALADMDYIATGITLDRVWFYSGIKCLDAIKTLCERCDYQFYFRYDNKPIFKPPPTIGSWEERVFTFTKNLINEPNYQENIDEVQNNIIIEGEKYSESDLYFKTVDGSNFLPGAVEEAAIADGSITTLKLAALAVVNAKIAVDAIYGDIIKAEAITTPKINSLAVTEALIAANAVTTTKIANDSIGTAKIIAGAIETAKIAVGAVDAGKIAASAVTAIKINAGAVEAVKIAAGAVIAVKIGAGAVTTVKLDALAVTAEKIAADAVTAAKILAGTITATEIAASAIEADKINALAITAGKIATDAIETAKIKADAVTAIKINVTTLSTISADMGTLTAGKIDVGSIEINAGTERILFGAATAPTTGTGIFIGKEGADYEFRCGNPAGHMIHWDGGTLNVYRDGAVYINIGEVQAGATRAMKFIDGDGYYKGYIGENLTGYMFAGTVYQIKAVQIDATHYRLGFVTTSPGGGGGTGDEPAHGDVES